MGQFDFDGRNSLVAFDVEDIIIIFLFALQEGAVGVRLELV